MSDPIHVTAVELASDDWTQERLAVAGFLVGYTQRTRESYALDLRRWFEFGKGNKPALLPLAPRTARAVDLAVGERHSGPIILDSRGLPCARHSAAWMIEKLARRARIAKHITPHSLRHSFITAALDAGVPLRDVSIAARHADPRTTTRYDRARHDLDRHATYIVAAFVAGAA